MEKPFLIILNVFRDILANFFYVVLVKEYGALETAFSYNVAQKELN